MKKTIALLILLLLSFQITSFAEGTQEQTKTTGLKVSPAVFNINENVKQGANGFLLNLKVYNDGTQGQMVEVIQEGFLKPEKDTYVIPTGKTIEIPIYLDVPKDAEIGKHDDSILVKTQHTEDKILQYRVLASFNITDGGFSKDKPDNQNSDDLVKEVKEKISSFGNILYIAVGIVILLIVIIVIFFIRRKNKRHNLFELYK